MDVLSNRFLEGFSPGGRERILNHLVYQDLVAGEYLFREGDLAQGVCLVVEGLVETIKTSGEHHEVLNSFTSGDFLGEVGVLDGHERSVDARAHGQATVAWIPTIDLLDVLGTESVGVTIDLFRNVLSSLRRTNDRNTGEILHKERLSLIGEMANSLMHDIRNPVQVILSSIDLMRIMHSDEETIDCCRKMEKQCDRLVAMAGELLEFANGETELNLERTDTTTLLRQFSAVNDEAVRRASTTFTVEDEPADLEVDSPRLLRVLKNLVSNAVEALNLKRGGMIDVHAWVRDSMLHLSVRDNGPGIPPAVQSRLFEPFVTHGKKGGTGLGLAIVKNIVTAHRGKITFETQAGQGTEFLVRVPQDHASPEVI